MTEWKRIFALIWSGQLVSVLSSAVVGYAIIFHLSLEMRSAEVLAWAALAGMLPQSVLGMVIGVWVDRWDRRRTMIAADCATAFCSLALAMLFWHGVAEIWHVYALLACRSAAPAFHMPAMQASVPLLAPAEQLTRIAGVNQSIVSLSNIAGPAIGALLINFMAIGDILLLDVAGAAVACATLLAVRIPRPAPTTARRSVMHEMHEGFVAIKSVRGMGTLMAMAIAVLFFLRPAGVQFPMLTLEHFGGGSYEMSLIEIVWGAGMLVGSAIMGARVYRVNRVMLLCAMNMVVGTAFFISGLIPSEWFAVFALLTAAEGVAGGVFNASLIAVVQSRIDSRLLGRVLSLYYSLGTLPTAVGLLAAGFLAEKLGLNTLFVVCGSVIFLIAAISALLPSLRHLGNGAKSGAFCR